MPLRVPYVSTIRAEARGGVARQVGPVCRPRQVVPSRNAKAIGHSLRESINGQEQYKISRPSCRASRFSPVSPYISCEIFPTRRRRRF